MTTEWIGMGDQTVVETMEWSWCLEEKVRLRGKQKSEGPKWRLKMLLLPGGVWVG